MTQLFLNGRRPCSTFLLLTATALSAHVPIGAASISAGAKPTSVLVLDVRTIGVDKAATSAAGTLASQLAQRIGARKGYKVLTMHDLRQLLSVQKHKQLLGCSQDVACVAELTRAAKADLVLDGSMGRIGRQYVLNLTLVNARKAAAAGRASQTFDDLARIPQKLDGLLAQVFGWQGAAKTRRYSLPAGKKLSFAVLDLSASGIATSVARNLTQILSAELKRIKGASVISRDDIAAMLKLEGDKQMMGCSDDSCIAEIGGALGVDKLIVGQVGKLAKSYVLSMRLIDSKRVRVDNRVTESFVGQADQLIPATRHAARRLLGISASGTGRLAISASAPRTTVIINEKSRGNLPMPPIAVPSGRYTLRLSKKGFFDWHSEVYIDPGDTTAVWATLKERPVRWYQRWWVWTLVGLAVAGGVTAAVLVTTRADQSAEGTVTTGQSNVTLTRELLTW